VQCSEITVLIIRHVLCLCCCTHTAHTYTHALLQALVAEMVGNFSKRLEGYGIVVKELTGQSVSQLVSWSPVGVVGGGHTSGSSITPAVVVV
jgi:hypothetical protein